MKLRQTIFALMVVSFCSMTFAAIKETAVTGITTYKPEHTLTMWYNLPATARSCSNPWMEYALPIGTGELGAMIMGGIMEDVLQFNEKTFWAGSPTVRGAYQDFGRLTLTEMDSLRYASGKVTDYLLSLDLETAAATASWTSPDSIVYKKEYLASYPAKCIAIHLTASKPNAINLKIALEGSHGETTICHDNEAMISTMLETIHSCAIARVVNVGGVF